MPPDGIALEQIQCGGGGMFRENLRVARIVRVGGGMSVLDAVLLAIDLERVPEQGDTEDAESSFQRQASSD